MTVEELIDDELLLGDNVSPTSADYLLRRRAALRNLRFVVGEIWWLRDHSWKKKDVDVIVAAATGKATLPIDFNSLGVYGGVYRLSDGGKLDEVPESVIMDINQDASYTADLPRQFAIHGQDETTFLPYIQIPRNLGATTLKIFYQPMPPILYDAGDPTLITALVVSSIVRSGSDPYYATVTTAADHSLDTNESVIITGADQAEYNGTWLVTVTGATTFMYTLAANPAVSPATGAAITATLNLAWHNRRLLAIPVKYHETVLAWGLKERMRESKGDARWEYAKGQYETGKRDLLKEEARFQSSFRQIPSFFGRSSY